MDGSRELISPNRSLTPKTLEVRGMIISGLMGYEITSTYIPTELIPRSLSVVFSNDFGNFIIPLRPIAGCVQ